MSLWSRLFSKQPKLPPINEDWKAGDFAQAIPGHWTRADGPREGVKYLVTDVAAGKHMDDGHPAWGLKIAGLPCPKFEAWEAVGFRKVYPDAFEEPRVTHRKISREKEVVQ